MNEHFVVLGREVLLNWISDSLECSPIATYNELRDGTVFRSLLSHVLCHFHIDEPQTLPYLDVFSDSLILTRWHRVFHVVEQMLNVPVTWRPESLFSSISNDEKDFQCYEIAVVLFVTLTALNTQDISIEVGEPISDRVYRYLSSELFTNRIHELQYTHVGTDSAFSVQNLGQCDHINFGNDKISVTRDQPELRPEVTCPIAQSYLHKISKIEEQLALLQQEYDLAHRSYVKRENIAQSSRAAFDDWSHLTKATEVACNLLENDIHLDKQETACDQHLHDAIEEQFRLLQMRNDPATSLRVESCILQFSAQHMESRTQVVERREREYIHCIEEFRQRKKAIREAYMAVLAILFDGEMKSGIPYGNAKSEVELIVEHTRMDELNEVYNRYRLVHARRMSSVEADSTEVWRGDAINAPTTAYTSHPMKRDQRQVDGQTAQFLYAYLVRKEKEWGQRFAQGRLTSRTADGCTPSELLSFWEQIHILDNTYTQLYDAILTPKAYPKTIEDRIVAVVQDLQKENRMDDQAAEPLKRLLCCMEEAHQEVHTLVQECSKYVAPSINFSNESHDTLRRRIRVYHKRLGTLQLKERTWKQLAERQMNYLFNKKSEMKKADVVHTFQEVTRMYEALIQHDTMNGFDTTAMAHALDRNTHITNSLEASVQGRFMQEGFEQPTINMLGAIHSELDQKFSLLLATVDEWIGVKEQHFSGLCDCITLQQNIQKNSYVVDRLQDMKSAYMGTLEELNRNEELLLQNFTLNSWLSSEFDEKASTSDKEKTIAATRISSFTGDRGTQQSDTSIHNTKSELNPVHSAPEQKATRDVAGSSFDITDDIARVRSFVQQTIAN